MIRQRKEKTMTTEELETKIQMQGQCYDKENKQNIIYMNPELHNDIIEMAQERDTLEKHIKEYLKG